MKVILSKYAGFCEGVERAYDMVKRIAHDPAVKRPIFVIGSLVHNADVVAEIEQLGVRKVDIEGTPDHFFQGIRESVGTLVITAHGMGPDIYAAAKKHGIPLVDTTCPRVIKVQRLAKAYHDRFTQIVIVGEKDHKEVKGIHAWANRRAVFVETEDDLAKLDLDPKRSIVMLSQTTQDQEFVEHAGSVIRAAYPHAEIIDSICRTTHDRQGELRQLAKASDAVVVIGGKESANSHRLADIARRLNPKTFFIQRAGQLDREAFFGCRSVAVTAGASTPKRIIEEVVRELESV